MLHISILFTFSSCCLKTKTLLPCIFIHTFGETANSFCLFLIFFFLTAGTKLASTRLINTQTHLNNSDLTRNLFRTERRRNPPFSGEEKKTCFSWWIPDERGGSHFLPRHICSLTTNQWPWKLGTWMRNNGKMKWRLSSLATLIFIERGKSDTAEDSLTFPHIRFFPFFPPTS